jgi:hypothetical protein
MFVEHTGLGIDMAFHFSSCVSYLGESDARLKYFCLVDVGQDSISLARSTPTIKPGRKSGLRNQIRKGTSQKASLINDRTGEN